MGYSAATEETGSENIRIAIFDKTDEVHKLF